MNDSPLNILELIIGAFTFETNDLWFGMLINVILVQQWKQNVLLSLQTSIVPGGYTKFIQAADVVWNAPLKSRLRECYDTSGWLQNQLAMNIQKVEIWKLHLEPFFVNEWSQVGMKFQLKW